MPRVEEHAGVERLEGTTGLAGGILDVFVHTHRRFTQAKSNYMYGLKQATGSN
jgi:hypothetical protein